MMDNAVALVQTYLRINGYLTVSEFPVVEALPNGGFQATTDLDILAFRFGHHDRLSTPVAEGASMLDTALGVRPGDADMLIGEVKEGRAELNQAAANPEVLAAALVRFGCCPGAAVRSVVQDLVRTGQAVTPIGHRVRLVAFGSHRPTSSPRGYEVMLLGHIVEFLRDYVREHWSRLCASESKDPALSFLLTLEKAGRGHGDRERSGAHPTD